MKICISKTADRKGDEIMIKNFRKENVLSTIEIIEQIFDGDLERVADWLSTPFHNEKDEWNGLETQVDCYLSAIKNYGDVVCTLSEDEMDTLCTMLTDEIFMYHEDNFVERDTKHKYKMVVLSTKEKSIKYIYETNNLEHLKKRVNEYFDTVQTQKGEQTYIKTYEDGWQFYF